MSSGFYIVFMLLKDTIGMAVYSDEQSASLPYQNSFSGFTKLVASIHLLRQYATPLPVPLSTTVCGRLKNSHALACKNPLAALEIELHLGQPQNKNHAEFNFDIACLPCLKVRIHDYRLPGKPMPNVKKLNGGGQLRTIRTLHVKICSNITLP